MALHGTISTLDLHDPELAATIGPADGISQRPSHANQSDTRKNSLDLDAWSIASLREQGAGHHTGFSSTSDVVAAESSATITVTTRPRDDGAPTTSTTMEALNVTEVSDPRATGHIGSVRGMLVLAITCTAQLIDNVFMTSVNIALPSMQRDLHIRPSNLQWIVSAYALAFGGFLLLAGVIADRYTKRIVFCGGMGLLAVASLACGLAQTEIHLIVCRAIQGLGAAATVPSAIGVLSTYFSGKDRHRALSSFGAAGAVGFSVGLVLGGLVTGTIGWRWIFRITTPMSVLLAIAGWYAFPSEFRAPDERKPALDVFGAALGTSGMILFTFALSSSDTYGWTKAFVLAPLFVSIAVLGGFAWTEQRVQNPIMPMHLWRLPGFGAIWIAGFFAYGWWSSMVYYFVLIAQDVLKLSPLQTAIRLIPIGVVGFVVSIGTGRLVEHFATRTILLSGLVISIISVVPAATIPNGNNGGFWTTVFPTSVVAVIGISVVYNVLSIALLSAVPTGAKSLAGGLINTAFQLGGGVGIAICATVSSRVREKHERVTGDGMEALTRGYAAALWMAAGMAGTSMIASVIGVRGGRRAAGLEGGAVH